MANSEAGILKRIANTLDAMVDAQGAGIPKPTVSDAGKVLMVDVDGNWTLSDIPSQLPAVESTDEGKVLMVDSSGEWGASELPAPSDNSPSSET